MDFSPASPESPIQLPSSNAMNPQPNGNTSVQSNHTKSVGRTGVGESLSEEKHACATVDASQAESTPCKLDSSSTKAQGSEDVFKTNGLPSDPEGQTDHVDKSPAVAELNVQRQREREQSAMRQAGIDPLAQSYQKDGTLTKGLEHVLSQNESKPNQGDGQSADSAEKSIISREQVGEMPQQGSLKKNGSKTTNVNIAGQAQAGGQGTSNVIVPAGRWMLQAAYSGAINLAAYAGPALIKGVGIASSAASEAASLTVKAVRAYQNSGLVDEPARSLAYMREWKSAAEGFYSSLNWAERRGASQETVSQGKKSLISIRVKAFDQASVISARNELKSLFEENNNNRGFIKVDLKCLELFNGLMSQFVSFLKKENAGWQDVRATLIMAISELKGEEVHFEVPDVPSEWKDVSCVPVRNINLGAGSSDIASVKVLDISGKGSPEYAELAGLMFWLELLEQEFKCNSKLDVKVVEARGNESEIEFN